MHREGGASGARHIKMGGVSPPRTEAPVSRSPARPLALAVALLVCAVESRT
jgi:hypothetical protein